jgi:hypothetical protein
MLAILLLCEKLLKVNYFPMGENSPNLVILLPFFV